MSVYNTVIWLMFRDRVIFWDAAPLSGTMNFSGGNNRYSAPLAELLAQPVGPSKE